jgi:hypothetical protein
VRRAERERQRERERERERGEEEGVCTVGATAKWSPEDILGTDWGVSVGGGGKEVSETFLFYEKSLVT